MFSLSTFQIEGLVSGALKLGIEKFSAFRLSGHHSVRWLSAID